MQVAATSFKQVLIRNVENRRKLRKWMQKPQSGGLFTSRMFRCNLFPPFLGWLNAPKIAPISPKDLMGNCPIFLHLNRPVIVLSLIVIIQLMSEDLLNICWKLQVPKLICDPFLKQLAPVMWCYFDGEKANWEGEKSKVKSQHRNKVTS